MIGTLLGGLQSSRNPGVNMAPGVKTLRRSRVGVPLRATRVIPAGTRPAVAPAAGRLAPLAPLTSLLNPGHVVGGAAGPGGSPYGPGGMAQGAPAVSTPAVLAPVMPVVAPGALPYMPVGGMTTFDQFLAANPQWNRQLELNNAGRGSLMAQFGFGRDAAGNLVADPLAAPGSVAASLESSKGQRISHAGQAASNRGALFSGGTSSEIDKATQAYEAGVAKAQGSLMSELGRVDQSELDTKTSLQQPYQDSIAGTHIADPADVLRQFAALHPERQGPAVDQYLNAYGKYLTPEQVAAFTHLKAGAPALWRAQQAANAAKAAADIAREADRQRRIHKAQAHLAADRAKAKKGVKPDTTKIRTGGIAGGHAP